MATATKHVKPDPVCGMHVPDTSVYRTTRNGETYFFCSEACRQAFQNHPSEYLVPGLHEHAMPENAPTPRPDGRKERDSAADWAAYTPLFVLVDICLLASAAQESINPEGWHGRDWMSLFMGWFLSFFAALKLFDLAGFANGFQRYDLLAGRARVYGLIYPFIELALGLAYLARFAPISTAAVTVVVMLFGSLGVLRTLIRGEKMKCACMGSLLNVPLSSVALVEDLSMAAMALAMLWLHRG